MRVEAYYYLVRPDSATKWQVEELPHGQFEATTQKAVDVTLEGEVI